MITLLLHLLGLLPFLCGGHRQLALENLALRHQLAVYKRTVARPKLRRRDRFFIKSAPATWEIKASGMHPGALGASEARTFLTRPSAARPAGRTRYTCRPQGPSD